MGYYIQVPTHKGKAEQIVELYDGMLINQPTDFSVVPTNMGLICVVDNGPFEAAGFCYDEAEFKVFADPEDKRAKKWVLIDRQRAEELTRYKK